MSSFRHPVGPERPGTYWRRRALAAGVLVLIVLVVVLIVAGFARGGASSAAPTPSSSPSRAGASSDTASGSSSGGASAPAGSASGAPSASASGAAAGGKDGDACAPEQIALTPITDKSSYGPTEDPQISMSIENTGTNSCHMDLGSSQQVLTISSGTEPYWTSKDCQTGGTNQDVTIKAGQKLTTPAITWDRTRSSTSTCDASRPTVTAGGASYHLQVSVGDVQSAATAQFSLN